MPKEPTFARILTRRDNATKEIIKALAHLPHERQIAIICSWIPLAELEEIAKFQKNR